MPDSPPRSLFSDFAASFHQATGLPLQWQAPGEFSIAEEEGIPKFCRVMSTGRKACATCVKTHVALQDATHLQIRTARCFAGLTSSAVPVVRDARVLGFLHTGHVYVDRPPGCAVPGRGCMLPGSRERRCACAGACRDTKKLSSATYEGALGLLRLFSSQLASAHVAANATPGCSAIEHIVRLLRKDVARDWRLGELATAAGMHPGYFSEQFHRHTGSTLTRFLATHRVAKARQLLELTGYPVSEIAFASGFRSISQFNRVFKAVSGTTPKAVREQPRTR